MTSMPLPRGLVISSFIWVIACFAATIGLSAPIQPTSGAYTPSVRAMLALLAVGACLLWPLARITYARGTWTPARVALDMITIMVAFHAIFWPLHLVTYWTAAQMLAIDLLLCGWIAATGAWIALAIRTGTRRTVWSTAWMAIVLAGVVLDAVGAPAPIPELAGPYAALLRLTPERTDSTVVPVWSLAIWPWILAAGAWAGVLLTAKRLPRTPSPATL
jgi:hypothetical protein